MPDDRIKGRFVHEQPDGREVHLQGRVRGTPQKKESSGSWQDRRHPDWSVLAFDEQKMRASYLADRRRLVPFLVPHRFEAKDDRTADGEPTNLALRKRLGYGVGLNQAYLSEILGHIRRAPVDYVWGELGGESGDEPTEEPEEGTTAHRLWRDATREGVGWTEFFDEVLEWMVTSPGGFVLVDRPAIDTDNQRDRDDNNVRAFARFLPWSHIEDWGIGESGLRWVKIAETRDEREPMDTEERGFSRFHLLYTLTDDGRTTVQRFDEDGEPVEEQVDLGVIEDPEGQPMLPLIPARYGRHPDIPYAGNGLLRGMDDIVIDLWNQISEMREEQRDIVFSFLAYFGENGQETRDQLDGGSRFVHMAPGDTLDVKGASGEGIAAGQMSFDMALKAWALTAKRKAQEAVEVAGPRSGKAISAEFEVDLKPLLVRIAEALDRVERNTMFVAAQLEGVDPSVAGELDVVRDKEFQVEEEALRIASIVREFKQALPNVMPGALQSEVLMRFAESLPFVDLNKEVENAAGEMVTLREVVQSQVEEIAEGIQQGQRNQGPFGGAFPNLNELEGAA